MYVSAVSFKGERGQKCSREPPDASILSRQVGDQIILAARPSHCLRRSCCLNELFPARDSGHRLIKRKPSFALGGYGFAKIDEEIECGCRRRCGFEELLVTGNSSKPQDRKSTRLNSSHTSTSYAVF